MWAGTQTQQTTGVVAECNISLGCVCELSQHDSFAVYPLLSYEAAYSLVVVCVLKYLAILCRQIYHVMNEDIDKSHAIMTLYEPLVRAGQQLL